ncbi:MAG TPA: Coenzyme F420 hydrogenase/dehydrogenase, beta subunit C-terminal domain [Chitinispirillaceae bacterium]|nr:Coenzyme F420 hydrogenase/dehydrogenase, beta subunit C-terminal domain [Chitinispirillaceae bacterium]
MKTLQKVDESQLCIGCGLCVGLSNSVSAKMAEGSDGFLHPIVDNSTIDWNKIKKACPGLYVGDDKIKMQTEYEAIWGPFKEMRQGYAVDNTIRWLGSSGGGITALLLYLLESNTVDAVMQTGPLKSNPTRIGTFLNSTKEEIVRCASSRYCPSSPLSKIGEVIQCNKKFAFVGRPCDVSALRRYMQIHPELQEKIIVLISFFCAATPSFRATEIVLKELGVTSNEEIDEFWYRGKGWPGFATVVAKNGNNAFMSYQKSWGDILSNHAHFRCKICPDGIGILADVVFADGWETKNGKPVFNEKDGKNLIIIRTDKGEDVIRGAVKDNFLNTKSFDLEKLAHIQPSQKEKRVIIGARLLALRCWFMKYPKCINLSVYKNLIKHNKGIFKNFAGTFKRILLRHLQ